MSNTPPAILKTCANCGLRKPLSAFMQLAGSEGTSYANICSACRGAGLEPNQKERDESTASDSSHTIDTKSKVKADTSKRDLNKQVEDDYFKDREKDQKTNTQLIDKKQQLVKGEKEHRDGWLKKNRFLDSNKTTHPIEGTRIHGSTAQSSAAERFDFTAPVEDTRTPQVKHSGAVFNQFKSWLGKSAPISGSANKQQTPATKNKETSTKDDITEYIDKTWGPNSRKR